MAMLEAPYVPGKRRVVRNHHIDSRVWDHVRLRPNDIIFASNPKSGTTWLQQIIGQLLSGGRNIAANRMCFWVDRRPRPELTVAGVEAQKHRRWMKSHLPFDALPYDPRVKYLFIGRDGRDTLWSLFNYHAQLSDHYMETFNDPAGRVGPPLPPLDCEILPYFRRWLAQDGYPWEEFWPKVSSWWEARSLPNVLLVHYADLQRDLAGEMKRIADFIGVSLPPDKFASAVHHSTFAFMKDNADLTAPVRAESFIDGPAAFFHQGESRKWVDTLTPEDVRRYHRMALNALGLEGADWLANGRMACNPSSFEG